MKISNLTQANKALLAYAAQEPRIGKNFTLERVLPLMKVAGNPQDRLKVVHIAGTSGKTSTAYFTAALLLAAGKKVGLTVSPHVDSVTERIQINGEPVSEKVFCDRLGEFLDVVEKAGQHPSYFELLYAFSLWVFDKLGVNYAVLETGVGGLYDATNVTSRPDKVCVITDIGFDHTHLLGNTLAKIASQKVGIVHEGNVVFMYEQEPEAMKVIRAWTAKHHAKVHIVAEQEHKPDKGSKMVAYFQHRNWHLAYQVYQHLEKRDGLKHLTRQVLSQTREVQVPGRMDTRKIDGKTLVMDGAHNQQKMTAFIRSFKKLYPGVKPAVLLSLKYNKDYEDISPQLESFVSRVVVTAFDATQDSKIHSMDPDELADSLREAGIKDVTVMRDQHAAFKALLAGPEKVCVITGSFYLLSRIRNNEKLI